MSDRLVITVDDEQAQRWFGELLKRGEDPSGLMVEIGELLTPSTKRRFDTGTAPDGTQWPELKDGSGRTPLMLTGRMRDDIAPDSGRDFVEINAGAKQARWHQEGTKTGLPARVFMGLSRDDVSGIDRLALAWVSGE